MSQHGCEVCKLRAYAERKPTSLIGRLWRWHTRWCPGWKAYQAELAQREAQADRQSSEGDRSPPSDSEEPS